MSGKSFKKSLELYAVLLRNNGGGVRKKEFRIANTLFCICYNGSYFQNIISECSSSVRSSSCAVALNIVTS